MPAMQATPESVFSEEYWASSCELGSLPERYRFSRKTNDQINLLCAQAALALYQGVEREPIPDGARLDYTSDNRWMIPGTVLLLDTEGLGIRPRCTGQPACQSPDKIKASQQFMPESAIMATAVSLFCRNALRPNGNDGPVVVYPFEKVVCNPEPRLHYGRIIRLAVVAYSYKGDVQATTRSVWYERSLPDVQGDATISQIRRDGFAPLTVGQTYHNPLEGYSRVRGAEVIMRGSMERVAVARKRRSLLTRLALAPQNSN